MEGILMKEKILKYLTKRRDSIRDMMQEHFTETGGIDQCQMEVFFTYRTIIKDIKNDRLD